ncbi:helix-turn-helix domain-containing protein [Cellulomonas palmilytica]|uniref:helix-turn-helix domain-containing protein n=1 Tax=Cellulomonas palmilytica TaxID=2608402 RepID=UPI001F293092|nr:helix-turn-helix transcriptional regulator [Cellulomonas palmilytica]UJP39367.1 helix-turn-helix transcriptional regulator [Cellulomonas palmilytica]
MDLDEMLGFDPNNRDDRHAEILVDEHDELLRLLVEARRRHNLDQDDVALLMGIDRSGVSRIESGSRDLHLSTLRRYAFAVGAVIRHQVEDIDTVIRREREAAAAGSLRALPSEWATPRGFRSEKHTLPASSR